MTRRATFTQAELERACKAARKLGARVEVEQGVIRIVSGPIRGPLPIAKGDENTCDEAFGME